MYSLEAIAVIEPGASEVYWNALTWVIRIGVQYQVSQSGRYADEWVNGPRCLDISKCTKDKYISKPTFKHLQELLRGIDARWAKGRALVRVRARDRGPSSVHCSDNWLCITSKA